MSDFVLPEELMMDIWRALPIKSTVRFRCVSKSWCSSLSDPTFIYKNLTLFDAENDHDLLLVLEWYHKCYSVVSHETLVATPLQVSPLRAHADPYRPDDDFMTYSCDDLVCFHDRDGTIIGVWNLTTGETKILPPVPNDLFELGVIGFGFDNKIQDYKIVKIVKCLVDDGNHVDAVFVYSLRTGNNCWRKLDQPNVPDRPFVNTAYCRSYRDGVFYWCNSYYSSRYRSADRYVDDSDLLIESFDVSSEAFNTISIPRQHRGGVIVDFCKLKDGSMLLITRDDDCDVEYELWVLLEVEVASSMTKLFNIDWQCGNKPGSLLGLWKNELVFKCNSHFPRLLIGDPSSKQEPKEIHIDEPLGIMRCLAWTKGKNSDPLN